MKEKVITLRVTEGEKNNLETEAINCNMTLSQFIRTNLKIYNKENNCIGKKFSFSPEVVCNLFTEIQKLKNRYPELDLDELEGSAIKLCQ